MEPTLIKIFSELDDHRVVGRTSYSLIEIVFLCISAVLSRCEGWEDIEDFGEARLDWLRKYFAYEYGIPSHDTIARVMSSINPKAFETCFLKWIQSIAKITEGEVVVIDGKTIRRSYDRKARKAALHMVSSDARTLLNN